MALSCGARCAKAWLITFNFIFWLSGAVIAGLGVWFLIDPSKGHHFHILTSDFLPAEAFSYLAYCLIGLGSLVFIIGFFGCCGAIQESKCLLGTYFFFLVIIFVLEAALGVLALTMQQQLLDKVEGDLVLRLQNNYDRPEHVNFTHALNFVQVKSECCGIRGHTDYYNSKWRNVSMARGEEKQVVDTCCHLSNKEDDDAWKNPRPKNVGKCQARDPREHSGSRYEEGCLFKLQEWLKLESTVLMAIGLGVAGLLVFGMMLAICLCRSVGEEV